MIELTKTQRAMMDILEDGKPHKKAELHKCCGPSNMSMVWEHLCRLRKKIRPHGLDVVCVARGYARDYQLVRLIGRESD